MIYSGETIAAGSEIPEAGPVGAGPLSFAVQAQETVEIPAQGIEEFWQTFQEGFDVFPFEFVTIPFAEEMAKPQILLQHPFRLFTYDGPSQAFYVQGHLMEKLDMTALSDRYAVVDDRGDGMEDVFHARVKIMDDRRTCPDVDAGSLPTGDFRCLRQEIPEFLPLVYNLCLQHSVGVHSSMPSALAASLRARPAFLTGMRSMSKGFARI